MTRSVDSVWMNCRRVARRLLRRGGIENSGMPGVVNKSRIVNYRVPGIVYCCVPTVVNGCVPGVVNGWKSRVVNWWMGRIVNR